MTVTEHLTSIALVKLIEVGTLEAGPTVAGEWAAVAPNPNRPEGYWSLPMPMLEELARWCDEHSVSHAGVTEIHRTIARVCDRLAPVLADDRAYAEDDDRPRCEATGRVRFACPDGTVWSAFVTLIDDLDEEDGDELA